jgi:hypothetical protein
MTVFKKLASEIESVSGSQRMTSRSERDAWLNIVKPAELDIHMASVGQAETNAAIVKEMFNRFPLAENARLLVHGCGTCQMLDYIALADFGNVDITFADFSPAMLEEGKKRLTRFPGERHKVVVDDIEHTKLDRKYDAVLLVLVLLHVDWRTSLENMMRLGPSRFYIIEQEQVPGVSAITSTGELLPSMQRYSEVAEMELVPRTDLVAFMDFHGYRQRWSTSCPVRGEKRMAGLVCLQ